MKFVVALALLTVSVFGLRMGNPEVSHEEIGVELHEKGLSNRHEKGLSNRH